MTNKNGKGKSNCNDNSKYNSKYNDKYNDNSKYRDPSLRSG